MRTRVFTFGLILIPSVATAQVGPAPILVAPTVPPAFRLLDEPAVQKDIGLTDPQKAAAGQIRLSWPLAANGLRLGRFGYVPADVMRAAIDQRTADFLAKDLTKEQRTRLDQIVFQLREREFGAHQAFTMAARDLRLRPDQMEDVRTLKALRVEEIATEVASGKRFEKIKTEVRATNGDTYEKMAEMLTRAQRERLKEMRGKPFSGKISLEEPKVARSVVPAENEIHVPPEAPPVRLEPAAAPPPPPKPKPGLYDLELKYLDSYEIGKELKLTDKQSGNIARAVLDFPGGKPRGRIPAGSEMEAHEYTWKVLANVLNAAQRERFDQIMMQRRARKSPETACTYPPTATSLKLTPVQLQQLSSGKRLADVLSRDQLAEYRKLLGQPYTLPTVWDDYLPVVVSAPPPPPPAPKATGFSGPYVQARDFLILTDRLKLTAEQVKKLRDLAEDEPEVRELIQKELALDDTPPVAGAGRGQTAVNVVTEHYRAAVEQQCWDVLEPAQQSIARKIFGLGRK
jgi:hypothetical protein